MLEKIAEFGGWGWRWVSLRLYRDVRVIFGSYIFILRVERNYWRLLNYGGRGCESEIFFDSYVENRLEGGRAGVVSYSCWAVFIIYRLVWEGWRFGGGS